MHAPASGGRYGADQRAGFAYLMRQIPYQTIRCISSSVSLNALARK
jgi:hypothetical protein